jgi:hypothetical protein
VATTKWLSRRLTRGRVCSEVFNAGPSNIYDLYRGLAPRQFIAIADERESPRAHKDAQILVHKQRVDAFLKILAAFNPSFGADVLVGFALVLARLKEATNCLSLARRHVIGVVVSPRL